MRDELLRLWPTEEDVRDCIKQEAEAIDEAVLLAVHQPMQFRRRDLGAGGASVARSEADLLDEFMSPHLPEGRLILPIVGNSGVGKSHVIKWLEAQLLRRPDKDRLHVIRVPKGSSLKGVLRLLLQGLEAPAFNRLREALTNARDHLDPDRAVRALQSSLRYRLEKAAKGAKQRIVDGNERAGDQELSTYGDTRMLPALMGDPLLEQEHWLSLGDDQPGVLSLMAAQVTQEGRQERDERRHEFVAEDLKLSDSIDLGKLSDQARQCYGAINRTDSTRRETAARVLNMVLDEAKNDLLQLGDNSLVELFAEVRAELHDEGKELILLVEDFAVLSGLQGALLQVMITEATRDGCQRLCTMRSALAYTEGYMAGRDTVLTRARSEWLIEDRPGDDEEILKRIELLVGAYLNAARAGREALRKAYASQSGGGLRDWVPSVDHEVLETAAQNVVEAFGRSETNYPLFPFNAAAVRQLSLRGSVDSRGRLLFNPRYVINNLLTRVLTERRSFAQGEFPPAHLADELRSAEVTAEVGRRVRAGQLRRYLVLLRVWGDQPATVAEAASLSSAVYEAFELDQPNLGPGYPLSDAERETSVDTAHTVRSGGVGDSGRGLSEARQVPAEEVQEQRWLKALEEWGSGAVLEQGYARELRRWIAEATYAFLPTDALLLKPRLTTPFLLKKVFLPRSRGQSGLKPDEAFVVVARDEELDVPLGRAALIGALLALVRRYGIHRSWNYDKAEVDGGLLRCFLEQRAGGALGYLRRHHFQEEVETLGALVRGLLIGARALGVPGAHDRAGLPELIAAVFDDAPPPPKGAVGPWAEVQASLRTTRVHWRDQLLEQVGARQGGAGAVHAVDAAALSSLVDAARADWELGSVPPSRSKDSDYSQFVRAFNDLRLGLEKALQDESSALADWLPGAMAWFGEDFDKGGVQEALRSLVTEVKKRGLVPVADYDRLRKDLSELPSLALVEARDAAIRLQSNPGRGEILSVLASLPARALESAKQFVDRMERFAQEVEEALEGRELSVGGNLVQEATRAVEDELDLLDALFLACEDNGP